MEYPLPPTLPPVLTLVRGGANRHDSRPTPASGGAPPSTERLTRGGYLLLDAAPRPDWEERRRRELGRCVTVAARTGADTVISHVSAAVLHGLWVPPCDLVHVTHPYHGRGRLDATDVARHTRPLDLGHDVECLDGLLVTSLDRTVLDCVTSLPPDWAMAAADSALRLVIRPGREPSEAEAGHAAHLRRRWLRLLQRRGPARGVVAGRAVLTHATPLAESPGESRLRCQLLAAGFPEPRVQPPVPTPVGTFYPDLALPDGDGRDTRWVYLEYDGEVKYGDDTAPGATRLLAEKRREDALRETGARVVRVVADDLTPQRRHLLVARLVGLAPRVAAAGLRPVPGLAVLPRPRRRC